MASDHAHTDDAHHGPTTGTYLKLAVMLALITGVEVYVYYTPFQHHKLFVPTLLLMSAVKFFGVVAFYMHLKYDHKIFRALFYGPFVIALGTIIALLAVFSYKAV